MDFKIKEITVDYNFMGKYPIKINEMTNEEILNKFYNVFYFSFIHTSLCYYGDPFEILSLVEDSLVLDRIDYKNLTNERKWLGLEIALFKLYYDLNEFIFGQDIMNYIIDNFKIINNDDLINIINDLNMSLFFGIGESIIITPTTLNDISATNDDFFLLDYFLKNEEILKNRIKKILKKSYISNEKFLDFFKTDVKNEWLDLFFDGFILEWINSFDDEILEQDMSNYDIWLNTSIEVYTIILCYFYLFIDEKDQEKVISIIKEIYNNVMNQIKEFCEVEFEVLDISLKDK